MSLRHCGETMNITIKPPVYSASACTAPLHQTTVFYSPCMPPITAPRLATRDFTVFIIDDDPGVLKSLARFVRAAGYAVQTFSSADELLAHGVDVPGCVVIDLLMPGIDGRQLQASLCKADDRSILFISGTTYAPPMF